MGAQTVEHLLRDHERLERLLAELDGVLDQVRAETDAFVSHTREISGILDRLNNELDAHVEKEELLFAALESFFPRDSGPLMVLRREHADIFLTFSRMRKAGGALPATNGNEGAPARFESYVRGALQLMRDHMYKEDRVLFPMIARLIPADLDAELLGRMRAVTARPLDAAALP